MKKIYAILSLLLTFVLLIPIPVKAADTDYAGSQTKWKVRFTNKNKMTSTFDQAEFNDVINEMQPGDSVTFTVDLKNLNSETTRWYMTNTVLKSLEEVTETKKSAASSGAYEYVLTYTNNAGKDKEIYNSETVGGEDEDGTLDDSLEGLNEATDNLEDYFYLDTFKKGQGGKITLKVALDGETQGNAYQDTRARLQMNFAVELDDGSSNKKKKRRGTVAKTGDDTNWNLYYILAAVGGAGMLALGGYGLKLRKEEKEGEE